MDGFTLGLAGTIGGSLGLSLVAATRAMKGLGPLRELLALGDNIAKDTGRKGIIKQTNVLSVFPDGIIRTRDGGYIRGWSFAPSESFYAHSEEVRRLYDRLALVLTSGLPENAVMQMRVFIGDDPGGMLNDQSLAMAANAGECSPVAQMLQAEEIEYYQSLAGNGNFRTRKFSVWLYVPGLRKGTVKSGFSGFNGFNGFSNFKELWRNNEKAVVCRYVADERECLADAKRHFQGFEQNFPLPLEKLSFGEVSVQLRLSHNPGVKSMPAPPREADTDWQSYLSRTAIRQERRAWFLWHGATPVTVVALFEPPESNAENPSCYPGLMRFLTTNPSLRGRFTVIPEFIISDKDKSVKDLKKDLRKMRETNTRPHGQVEFKDEKVKRAYAEKKQMLQELTSPGKALTSMRWHIVLRGREVSLPEERKAILAELEEQARSLVKTINEHMQGAQADLEEPEALREVYEKLLVGEISPKPREREIQEQALSLACFLPAETDWRGVTRDPHNFFLNTSGELTGVNLLRNPYAATPLTVILGSSGSGKSVLAAELICGFLATVPNARVRACDYGGSLAPLVNLFDGRYFRFSDRDPRTINVWDYDGLEQCVGPDDEQIELVVKDTLILLGVEERSETGRDFVAVLEKCVRQVYADEVPRNAPGRRHEPRLAHLIRKLRSFPFPSPEERALGQRMASRLENFEGNPWVDAPTHESYRAESRFDVFELSTLDKLPDALRSCLAFRIGARVGAGDEEIEGVHPPTLVVYDEVHEYVHNEYLSHTLRGAERTTRHGRKKNKVPILITHSFDDIKDFPGFTSNIGSLFVGKQDDITSLAALRKWNKTVEQTVYHIDNRKGVAHQFVYVTGQGETQKVTTIQVYLSPASLWTFTTDPPEDQARKSLAHALPHWTWANILVALARQYPRGLSFEGKAKPDEAWLQEMVRAEAQTSATYRQFVRQMKAQGANLFAVPEEIEFDELADEALLMLDTEIGQFQRDSFEDVRESLPEALAGFDVEMKGVVVVSTQGG